MFNLLRRLRVLFNHCHALMKNYKMVLTTGLIFLFRSKIKEADLLYIGSVRLHIKKKY